MVKKLVEDIEPCVQQLQRVISGNGYGIVRSSWRGALYFTLAESHNIMFWTIVGALLFVFVGIPLIGIALYFGWEFYKLFLREEKPEEQSKTNFHPKDYSKLLAKIDLASKGVKVDWTDEEE